MTSPRRTIVALGGGGFSMEPNNPLLDEFVLAQASVDRPRICFLATASGDSEAYVAEFYRAFTRLDCRPSDLSLFRRGATDLDDHLAAQDIVYVGGGSTANLLAVWRAHGLDIALRRSWERGTVLAGISAGMNCWFTASVTDSFGGAAPLHDGLGLVAGSACPHYDGEPQRRPAFRRLIAAGELPDGWSADDGAALVFSGSDHPTVVSSTPQALGYRVTRDPEAPDGVIERPLPTRYLGG